MSRVEDYSTKVDGRREDPPARVSESRRYGAFERSIAEDMRQAIICRNDPGNWRRVYHDLTGRQAGAKAGTITKHRHIAFKDGFEAIAGITPDGHGYGVWIRFVGPQE